MAHLVICRACWITCTSMSDCVVALVFSKTSFQSARISPHNPRAVYFADDVAVGFVRGGDVLELAGVDPKQGVVFYTLTALKTGRRALSVAICASNATRASATEGVP